MKRPKASTDEQGHFCCHGDAQPLPDFSYTPAGGKAIKRRKAVVLKKKLR